MKNAYFDFVAQNSFFCSALKAMVITIAIYMFCATLFLELYHVPSNSMSPNLMGEQKNFNGDNICVFKGILSLSLKRGDIIVFISPIDNKTIMVKRLVGLPEEEICIKNETYLHRIYIDGRPLTKPVVFRNIEYEFILHTHRTDIPTNGWGKQPLKIPKDSYFALGDNTVDSEDSRMWCFVPKNNIIGKVYAIYYPFYRVRIMTNEL